MNRAAFLGNPDVASFVDWAEPLVSGERALVHGWRSPKWGSWGCASLPGAYENFQWRFTVTMPGRAVASRGRSRQENEDALSHLRRSMRLSADAEDAAAFLNACLAVVAWGGVQLNGKRLRELGSAALPTLMSNAGLLAPQTANLEALRAITDMNSGFSKLYSLILDDFPIYDSRVACAIASLVTWYVRESGHARVPVALSFGIPLHRSAEHRYVYGHPRLYHGQTTQYASANVRAAWLLSALVKDMAFAGLPKHQRVFALQSALFMVGYRRLDGVA